MRPLFPFAFALIAVSASAVEPSWCVLLDAKDADGHHVQFRYDARQLDGKPKWMPGEKAPPLSLEAATKIAWDAALRQAPLATGLSWGNIKLLKSVCDWPGGRVVTWFWDFSVSPVIDRDPKASKPPTFLPERDIVILLDGEVVQPTPVE
jgi:hypothetical protein